MYSYDRRTAAAAFFNISPVPRRATSGSSLTPILARVRQVEGDTYSLEVEIRGTLRGDIQTVSDELRFAGIEMREFVGNFFRKPPVMRPAMTLSLSDQTVVVGSDGLHISMNVDFRLPDEGPEKVRSRVEAVQRFFLNIADISFET